jgi:hypothetical protein
MNARKAKQRGRGASRYKQIDRLVVGRLSTTYARTHSNTVMLVTAIRASTMVILANYRADQNFNKAEFDVGVAVRDEYGQGERKKAFSFAFDRATLFTNKSGPFRRSNLMKVAKEFKFLP